MMASSGGLDSPRSWVVLAFLSWCMMMCTVSVRAVGVIYVGLVEHFRISREEASLPITLHMSVLCCTSLLAGYLSELCSYEVVALGSVLLTSTSMMACYFAPSMDFITFFFGVIHGGATSGMFVVSNVLPSLYFKKWRATAAAIAWSSQCCNVYFIPQLANYFRVTYGTPELFLLIGALCLNALPACIVIKTPPWALKAKKQPSVHGSAASNNSDLSKRNVYGNGITMTKVQGLPEDSEMTAMLDRAPTLVHMVEDDSHPQNGHRAGLEIIGHSSGSSSVPDIPNRPIGVCSRSKSLWASTAHAISSWKFYVDALSYGLEVQTMSTYMMVYADMARDKGFSVDTSVYILHAYCTADVVFRVASGLVVDRKYVPIECLKFIGFVAVIAGAQAVRMSTSLVTLVLSSLLFGSGTGTNVGIIAALLQHDFEKESLAVMFGGVMFVSGLVVLTRPPLVGYFRDTMGDYDGLFHTLTAANALFALIWLLRALLAWRQRSSSARASPPSALSAVGTALEEDC